jgi:hypothetical protein
VPEIPSQLLDIAARLGRNERVNRRPIETLLKWFDAKKRGKAVISNIRTALLSAGLETEPDFTQGSIDDHVTFRLIGGAGAAASSTAESDRRKPTHQVGPKPEGAEEQTILSTSTHFDEPSDDFLEPESDDDEQQAADDDRRPVVSKPADWTIASLREKWDDGKLDLQPR